MAKTAYLLTFHATTRIIVDSDKNPFEDDELFGKCVAMARKKMLEFGLEEYLHGDNAELEEDIEVPFDDDDNGDVYTVRG